MDLVYGLYPRPDDEVGDEQSEQFEARRPAWVAVGVERVTESTDLLAPPQADSARYVGPRATTLSPGRDVRLTG